MQEVVPYAYDAASAAQCQPVLQAMVRAGLEAVQALPR
jgi:hypothetical protein